MLVGDMNATNQSGENTKCFVSCGSEWLPGDACCECLSHASSSTEIKIKEISPSLRLGAEPFMGVGSPAFPGFAYFIDSTSGSSSRDDRRIIWDVHSGGDDYTVTNRFTAMRLRMKDGTDVKLHGKTLEHEVAGSNTPPFTVRLETEGSVPGAYTFEVKGAPCLITEAGSGVTNVNVVTGAAPLTGEYELTFTGPGRGDVTYGFGENPMYTVGYGFYAPGVELEVNNSANPTNHVVCRHSTIPAGRPTIPCRVRAIGAPPEGLEVTLASANGGLRFPGVADVTANLTLPADGGWVSFAISGQIKSMSTNDTIPAQPQGVSQGRPFEIVELNPPPAQSIKHLPVYPLAVNGKVRSRIFHEIA
jgi:hypothetical protein